MWLPCKKVPIYNSYPLIAQLEIVQLKTSETSNKRFISVLKMEHFSIICKAFASASKERLIPMYSETFSNASYY